MILSSASMDRTWTHQTFSNKPTKNWMVNEMVNNQNSLRSNSVLPQSSLSFRLFLSFHFWDSFGSLCIVVGVVVAIDLFLSSRVLICRISTFRYKVLLFWDFLSWGLYSFKCCAIQNGYLNIDSKLIGHRWIHKRIWAKEKEGGRSWNEIKWTKTREEEEKKTTRLK